VSDSSSSSSEEDGDGIRGKVLVRRKMESESKEIKKEEN
jgi:hypothetical protein